MKADEEPKQSTVILGLTPVTSLGLRGTDSHSVGACGQATIQSKHRVTTLHLTCKDCVSPLGQLLFPIQDDWWCLSPGSGQLP